MAVVSAGDLGLALSDLISIEEISKDTRLMVRDKGDSRMFTVADVEIETHDEADGSRTVWLNVVAY